MGPQSVGWHRDLRLHPNSTIGVYSCHAIFRDSDGNDDDSNSQEASKHSDPWKIGLKVAWDIETPGLVLDLQNGDSYFMLGECNTINQHCVLSGSEKRFSTTHRNGLVSIKLFLLYISSRWAMFFQINNIVDSWNDMGGNLQGLQGESGNQHLLDVL